MPYSVGEKGSYGCSGYPVIKDDDKTVMGCHDTLAAAQNQITAINMSEAEQSKKRLTSGVEGFEDASSKPSVFDAPAYEEKEVVTSGGGVGIKNPQAWPGTEIHEEDRKRVRKMEITEGDFVIGMTVDGPVYGSVEHIMWEGGTLGEPGMPYSLESMPPDNPAMSVRVYEEENGRWLPTPYSIGMMYLDATLSKNPEEMPSEEDYEDMEMMMKAETYSPTDGMKAAARRAIRWKEEGKATGAGTPVGWGRARDIVAGRSMSLSVVRRMFSFFSRHEVDKKGKDFYNTSNPSNGRIMWDAWGGDAGFTWSRAIVERNKDKALFNDIFGLSKININRQPVDSVFFDLGKRERTAETRQRLAESGEAMPDGSYPIVTIQDLRNAIQAFGRASDPEATRRHIMRRARALGRIDLIPENWTKSYDEMSKAIGVGSMVSWNSSGGTARGKITRIIRSGTYNVPGTDVSLNASEDDPVAVITLYRDGEATDITVAHKLKTLRAS